TVRSYASSRRSPLELKMTAPPPNRKRRDSFKRSSPRCATISPSEAGIPSPFLQTKWPLSHRNKSPSEIPSCELRSSPECLPDGGKACNRWMSKEFTRQGSSTRAAREWQGPCSVERRTERKRRGSSTRVRTGEVLFSKERKDAC